jgi:hypothetical protein
MIVLSQQTAPSRTHTQRLQEKGASCIYRTPAHQQPMQEWSAAPACSAAPNKTNSISDQDNRLWGYESSKPCAYKNGSLPITAAASASATVKRLRAPSYGPQLPA